MGLSVFRVTSNKGLGHGMNVDCAGWASRLRRSGAILGEIWTGLGGGMVEGTSWRCILNCSSESLSEIKFVKSADPEFFTLKFLAPSTMADEEPALPLRKAATNDGPSQASISKYRRGTNVDAKVQGPETQRY
jgi:hypothetical protein